MAAYRLKLSDGTTTINLYDGTDAKVRHAGLALPTPSARTSFITPVISDGGRLASSFYNNRDINITIKIWGTSLADLRTNIRTIQRLLNDAKERAVSGYGAKVYLEYQWGDADNQSIYFDVLRGDLILPDDFFNAVLRERFYVINARLALICKPFGRYTNQDINQDTLENSQTTRTLQENLLTGYDTSFACYGVNWPAQTFTTGSAYTAVGASIQARRNGTIGIVTMAIYATSGGLPTGAALATGTVDASAHSIDIPYDWLTVTFTTPVALSNATLYALVISLSGGDAANYIAVQYDTGDGEPNGQRCTSTDSGASWAANAGHDLMFAIYSSVTAANYQDVTTAEAHGDVPAKLYMKVSQTGATGTKKVWIAKRSGARQTDDLWYEGEQFAFNNIVGSGTISCVKEPVSGLSNDMQLKIAYSFGAGLAADTVLTRLDLNISTPPRGLFRVLARVKIDATAVTAHTAYNLGVGYSYGGKTKAPSEAAGEYYGAAADNVWEILDLGLLSIPPIPESEIASNSTFQLRIFQYATSELGGGSICNIYLDWIFLLPVDEGVAIIDDVVSTDILAIDGISDPANIYKIDSDSKITDYPDYVGRPFNLGREPTRIYFLRDDIISMGFTLDTKYQPQFLLI